MPIRKEDLEAGKLWDKMEEDWAKKIAEAIGSAETPPEPGPQKEA